MLHFAKPVAADEAEVLAFMQLFYSAGETVVNGSAGLDYYKDYERWLAYLGRIERGEEAGFVPSVVYLARDEAGRIVGMLDIRPDLPDEKLHWGHVGYSVAPPFRGRGHAVQMLRWATEQLRDAGVDPARVDCYEGNAASRRVLEKAGYRLVDSYVEQETNKCVLEYTSKKEREHG